MSGTDRGRSPERSGGGPSQASRSRSGQRGTSPARSSASGPQAPAGWTQGMGFDPAKPAASAEKPFNNRLELPPDAYSANKDMFTLRGNKLNTEGRPAPVEVNQYRMKKLDLSKKIYQYDVALSPDPTKKGPVVKKILGHPVFKAKMAPYQLGMWIFDGRSLAWAPGLVDRGEIRVQVDLDDGRPARNGRSNVFNVTIRKTAEIQLSALQGYLEHKTGFTNGVQEAINFLDHVLRQRASQNLLAIKRNFYDPRAAGKAIDTLIEVHKGTYASLRLCNNLTTGGTGMALNADVANTCFWIGNQSVDQLLCSFLSVSDRKFKGLTSANVSQHLRPVRGANGTWQMSEGFKQMRKLSKLRFNVKHANRTAENKTYTIVGFVFGQSYGGEGANARNHKFSLDGKDVTVWDYYQKKYKVTLRYANLPLIDAGKAGFIPMELAYIQPMQRYQYKLNPDQTAAMIKIAVTRPNVRRQEIQKNVATLQLQSDPYLKQYGIEFETQFTRTEGKIISPPLVNFGQGVAKPEFSGRWDLRGKKFWKQNSAPLSSWGFIAMDGCVNKPALAQFASEFKKTFSGHGGKVTADAHLLPLPGNIEDGAAAIAWAHGEITRRTGYTQLLFVVVGHKNSPHYIRIKKSADCRFGILTQVVQSQAVQKNNGQYHSNVCLKVNAKLGGATSRTAPPWKTKDFYFPKERPTMIVGVDVSHSAPGMVAPSFAAMTMSMDRDATRYGAMCETNGYRTEMLTPSNVHMLFWQLTQKWMQGHDSQFPKHVIYFRDGVAEGMFAQVIDYEITEIKKLFREKAPKMEPPKFTVIVATKRHHIRFFPQKGDNNGNPLPGTLLEKEVTHPFMFDFYMSSHVAIQGTARPVHYHVILDEMGIPVNELQKMIYHQCYSYARSTTPVSLHPAVYYAHLASNRARAHENIATSEGHRAGGKGHEVVRDQIAKGKTMESIPRGAEAPKMLTLGGKPEREPVANEMRQRDFFRGTMWYI